MSTGPSTLALWSESFPTQVNGAGCIYGFLIIA